jgi:hypothetical protein
MTPLRIQRKRMKGWKNPPNTVYCGRPGKYSNDFSNVYSFKVNQLPTMNIEDLRNKNLSCWCKLCEKHKDGKPLNEDCAECSPCHVDSLGKAANE